MARDETEVTAAPVGHLGLTPCERSLRALLSPLCPVCCVDPLPTQRKAGSSFQGATTLNGSPEGGEKLEAPLLPRYGSLHIVRAPRSAAESTARII
eukprot:scaffold336_cov250-Pinguiococcus_pyrenoidosus.AAC.40